MDVEALAAGLKSGAADAILFPDDALGDAALIVSAARRLVPARRRAASCSASRRRSRGDAEGARSPRPARGRDLVPRPRHRRARQRHLVAAQRGRGAARAAHGHARGDRPARGHRLVAASLYDSSLLHTICTCRATWRCTPASATTRTSCSRSAATTPHFQPPAGLPGVGLRPRPHARRGRRSPRTSGSRSRPTSRSPRTRSSSARRRPSRRAAKFLGVTYTARGEVGFDVLLVFSPFSFIARLLGVGGASRPAIRRQGAARGRPLAAHLEGAEAVVRQRLTRGSPSSASTWGSSSRSAATRGAEAPPTRERARARRRRRCEAPVGVAGRSPRAPTASVVLAEAATVAGEVWAAPDAELEAVQDVAPLDRVRSTTTGPTTIDGPRRSTITGAGVEGGGEAPEWAPMLDWFAPAQYDDLTPHREAGRAVLRGDERGRALRHRRRRRCRTRPGAATVTPDYEVRVLDEAGAHRPQAGRARAADRDGDLRQRDRGGRQAAMDAGPFAPRPVTSATADAVTGVRRGPSAATARRTGAARRATWQRHVAPQSRSGRPSTLPSRPSRTAPDRLRTGSGRGDLRPCAPQASPRSRRGRRDDRRAHVPALAAPRPGPGARRAPTPRTAPRSPAARASTASGRRRRHAASSASSACCGPDAVTGLAPRRRCCARSRGPTAPTSRPHYFPFVELAAPDLPWLLTPGGARPGQRPAAPLARARRGARAGRGHARAAGRGRRSRCCVSTQPADRRRAARPRGVVGVGARAVARRARRRRGGGRAAGRARSWPGSSAPRRLLPDSAWLACVVPAFDGGVDRAGSAETVPAGAEWTGPAWDHRPDRWPGRAARLPPLALQHRAGRRLRGALPPPEAADGERRRPSACRRWTSATRGRASPPPAACCSTGGRAATRPASCRARGAAATRPTFQPPVTDLLADAAVRADVRPPDPEAPYDPRRQDPVVGPPLYGAWPAGVTAVPQRGWVRDARTSTPSGARPPGSAPRVGAGRPGGAGGRARGTRRARCGRRGGAQPARGLASKPGGA